MPTPALEDLAALRETVAAWRRDSARIALVPTMGALHRGHLALVEEARRRADRTVVSIFVNPTQFGPNEDFSKYPRAQEADLALLGEAKADLAWCPSVETMYRPGFSTTVSESVLTVGLCGPVRPGHFAGVATVVLKLVNQVGADVALFGEKDFQQLRVVQRMVRDLDVPVEIRGVPTLREADGLALSSRNRYLGEAERHTAPMLYATLTEIARRLVGQDDADPVLADGIARLHAAGFARIDYLALCDADTLEPLSRGYGRPARLLAAARLGGTRLIDNIPVPFVVGSVAE